MLAVARKNAIREQLREHKSVRISTLAAELNVTNETIRRDLKEMENAGELIRTHGGAYIIDGVENEIDITTRQVLKIAEKEILAEKCDSLIQNGDHIFLDGSTTCWFVARKIVNRRITVLTNSLEIAKILSVSDSVKLFMIGGEYVSRNLEFMGEGAIRMLEHYYVDKALISCRSVSMTRGITDTNDNNASIHRTVLSHALTKYLVIDSSKLDGVSFSEAAPLEAIDAIIMDKDFPPEWKQHLTKLGIRIY